MYKLLDVFCGGGGCSMGYHRAGFEVTGVDLYPQKDYPFEFIQADGLEYLRENWHRFDAVHLSPPCQRFSSSTRDNSHNYPDLITPLRPILDGIDIPYIIENVNAAPIRKDIVLYGYMFGLKVIRKRVFELGNWFMLQPGLSKKNGSVIEGDYISVIGKGSYRMKPEVVERPKFDKGSIRATWQYAMGIYWINDCSTIAEAVPPAYTEYIGSNLIEYLNNIKPIKPGYATHNSKAHV